MSVQGVLFDFSGTLMRVEPVRDWLGAVLAAAHEPLPAPEFETLVAALEAAGALPGGTPPRAVPAAVAPLWAARDRSAAGHRSAYTALTRQVRLPRPDLYDALYERHMRPEAWRPYPDARTVLTELAARGVPVAVVSNIGWDLRPVFRAHGLDAFVDAYVLSFEHGVQKPAATLFERACRQLGVAPRDVLMVGDDAVADGGAASAGCAVHLVRHLPADERPDGLLPVLEHVA